jgi:cytochrome c biogenesis protein ResB
MPNKTRYIFSFLASVKAFIIILAFCGIGSLFGIIIPQNAGNEEYTRLFGDVFSKMIIVGGLDHVFSSPWLILLLTVLSVNLAFCLGQRIVTLIAVLRRGKTERAGAIGSLILHLGFLIVLAGAVVQHLSGDKQEVFVVEGNEERIERFNINVILHRFSIIRNARGEAVNFRSDLEIRDLDEKLKCVSASMVNSPLKYRNLYFYQLTYGKVSDAVKDFHTVIADSAGDTLFNGIIPYRDTFRIGKNGLSLVCTDFTGDFYYDFENRTFATRSHEHDNPAFKVTLFSNGMPVDSQWLFQRFPQINGKLGSYSATVPSFTPLFYSGIQVRKKPGTPYILAGIIAMSVGLILTLLFPIKRRNDDG